MTSMEKVGDKPVAQRLSPRDTNGRGKKADGEGTQVGHRASLGHRGAALRGRRELLAAESRSRGSEKGPQSFLRGLTNKTQDWESRKESACWSPTPDPWREGTEDMPGGGRGMQVPGGAIPPPSWHFPVSSTR